MTMYTEYEGRDWCDTNIANFQIGVSITQHNSAYRRDGGRVFYGLHSNHYRFNGEDLDQSKGELMEGISKILPKDVTFAFTPNDLDNAVTRLDGIKEEFISSTKYLAGDYTKQLQQWFLHEKEGIREFTALAHFVLPNVVAAIPSMPKYLLVQDTTGQNKRMIFNVWEPLAPEGDKYKGEVEFIVPFHTPKNWGDNEFKGTVLVKNQYSQSGEGFYWKGQTPEIAFNTLVKKYFFVRSGKWIDDINNLSKFILKE